jgi:uncharacterized Zn finger protein
MKIEINCSQCGSNRFDYPVVLKDESVIACADCGHEVGTVAKVQEMILARLAASGSRSNGGSVSRMRR